MAGKADHRGFGHIRKLPSGRHQASYIGPDLVRHNGPTTYDTKEDAGAWLYAERQHIASEDWQPPAIRRAAIQRDTFEAYARRWVDNRRTKKGPLKPRTKAHYTTLLDRILVPAFGTISMRNITAEAVEKWHDTLDPATPTLNAHAYALLSSICKTASEKKILSANPCMIRGAAAAPTVRKIEPATIDELAVIVQKMPERYRLMTLLAAWCALRFGELTELRRRDIVVRKGIVKIHRAVVWVEGVAVVGTPKSDAGHRDVAIPPHLMPEVKAHLSTLGAGQDALLFPSASDANTHLRPATLARVYYPARDAAGRPDLPFHGLRHTGATNAAVAGATLAELMHRLGHSTVHAALRYQHLANGRDAAIAAKLSEMAGESR